MSLYNKSEWKTFRDEVIELDGHKCQQCGRNAQEVILQVHHKQYIKGRKPWEYPLQECQTLCKGCHSSIHGITKPQIGWEFISQDDLGDLTGTCENCGASIRHCFVIQHENWGTIEVGTFCCDKLTDTTIASNLIESQTSYKSRKKTFINSKRWKNYQYNHSIKQSNFNITITQQNTFFTIGVNDVKSKTQYASIEDAKSKIFDIIETGELIEYFKTHNIPITSINKKKTKK